MCPFLVCNGTNMNPSILDTLMVPHPLLRLKCVSLGKCDKGSCHATSISYLWKKEDKIIKEKCRNKKVPSLNAYFECKFGFFFQKKYVMKY